MTDGTIQGTVCEFIADAVAQHVAEIPDRDSPDDQPEMMLVTADELRNAVRVAFERWFEEWPGRNAVSASGGAK